MIIPSLLPSIQGIVPRQKGIAKRSHWRGVGRDLAVSAIEIGFLITFLAHQAWVMTDAVIRTMFRLFRRRRLLEWVTAAQVSREVNEDRRSVSLRLAGSFAFAAATLTLLRFAHSGTEPIAAPFVTLWAFSPVIAWWASSS